MLNLCSTKYAPTIGREQRNTHKKYVQDMTKILRQKMCSVSGAHRFNIRNGSVDLIGQLSLEVQFSKPPLIAAMLVSKKLFSNTCQTLVLLLVTNQLTHQHIYESNLILGAHGFNVKSVSPAEYTAHFLAQDILHVFLVGVLLFTPYIRSILCTTKIQQKISSISVTCSLILMHKIVSCCCVLPTSFFTFKFFLGLTDLTLNPLCCPQVF